MHGHYVPDNYLNIAALQDKHSVSSWPEQVWLTNNLKQIYNYQEISQLSH